MFPALFPVPRDALSDVAAAETAGAEKRGGDGEKKEQFARLLFVSLENEPDGGKAVRSVGEMPVPAIGVRSLALLASSLFEKKGEGVAIQTVDEEIPHGSSACDDLLMSMLAPALADGCANMVQARLSSGVPAESVDQEASQLEASELNTDGGLFDRGVPEDSLAAMRRFETVLQPFTEVDDAMSEAGGPHGAPTGRAFALSDLFESAAGSDPKIQEMFSHLQLSEESNPEFAAKGVSDSGQIQGHSLSAPRSSGAAAVLDARQIPASDEGVVSRDGEQRRALEIPEQGNVAAVRWSQAPAALASSAVRTSSALPLNDAASDRTDTASVLSESAASSAEQAGSSAPFSMSMMDNVRPRRAFPIPDLRGSSSDDASAGDVSRTLRGESPILRTQLLSVATSQTGEASSDGKTVTDLTSATVSERALKAAAESELSTNRLTEGREQEQSIFPAARDLFGEPAGGKNASQPAAVQQQPLSRQFSILKDTSKESDLGRNTGKETLEAAASSVASRSSQIAASSGISFSSLLSGEIPLQGRGAAALEDGMQHVVRFLRTEGRQAASIIVDPPALGRIEIELVTIAKGVEASIKVSSEQVRQLVQDHITVLRNHLEQQGVHLGEFVVDLRDNSKGNSGRGAFAENGNSRRRGFSVTEADGIEEEIPTFGVDLEHGLLSWVA